MTDTEMIPILFKEYDTLRSELVSRINYWYTLAGLALLAFGWLVQRNQWRDPVTYVALVLLVIAGTCFALLLSRDVRLIAARIRELEAEINQLAGRDLLKWETRLGNAKISNYLKRKGD
jgi:hypothetical protein